jgi:hypothetical protein
VKNLVVEGGRVVFKFTPEIRCMQYAKCIKSNVGDSWLRKGCAINFETRPRVHLIFAFFERYFFNVFLLSFFAARSLGLAGCKNNYESLTKAHRRRHF